MYVFYWRFIFSLLKNTNGKNKSKSLFFELFCIWNLRFLIQDYCKSGSHSSFLCFKTDKGQMRPKRKHQLYINLINLLKFLFCMWSVLWNWNCSNWTVGQLRPKLVETWNRECCVPQKPPISCHLNGEPTDLIQICPDKTLKL